MAAIRTSFYSSQMYFFVCLDRINRVFYSWTNNRKLIRFNKRYQNSIPKTATKTVKENKYDNCLQKQYLRLDEAFPVYILTLYLYILLRNLYVKKKNCIRRWYLKEAYRQISQQFSKFCKNMYDFLILLPRFNNN